MKLKNRLFLSSSLSVVIFTPLFSYAAEWLGIVPGCGGGPCNFCDFLVLASNIINFCVFTLAVPLATIMFSYAGFLYIMDAGSGANLNKAKTVFTNVLIGLFFVLAAWLIVDTIFAFLAKDTVTNALRGRLTCERSAPEGDRVTTEQDVSIY